MNESEVTEAPAAPPPEHYLDRWRRQQQALAEKRARMVSTVMSEPYRRKFDTVMLVVVGLDARTYVGAPEDWSSAVLPMQVTINPSAVSEVTSALRLLVNSGFRLESANPPEGGNFGWWRLSVPDESLPGGKFKLELNAYFAVEYEPGKPDRPAVCRMVKVGEEPQPPRPIYKMVCDGGESPEAFKSPDVLPPQPEAKAE